MTLRYTLDEPTFRIGAARNFDHRAPLRRIFRPALGLLLIVQTFLYRGLEPPSTAAFGLVMLSLGLLLVFDKPIAVRKAARSPFKDRGRDQVHCILMVDEQRFELDTGISQATASWELFIGFKVCPEGVLLYPQHRIFYWVPQTAQLEGGTWSEFCDLLTRHVGRTAVASV